MIPGLICGGFTALALLALAVALNLYAMPVPSGFGYCPEEDDQ